MQVQASIVMKEKIKKLVMSDKNIVIYILVLNKMIL